MDIYEVPKVPEEKRYWVVRAEGGLYFDHFTQHGLIALGHLNCLDIKDTPESGQFYPSEDKLSQSFIRYHDEIGSSRHRTSSHLTQIKSFIYEMSVGDWVVTVGDKLVRFGRIIGRPYIENEPVTVVYDAMKGRLVKMDFTLRRSVVWGPSILRKELPYGLSQSFQSNLTLFCLDKHWQAVHHSLYPAFVKDNHLYLSSKIRSKDRIKNYSVSAVLTLLNEIEVIGKEVENFDNLENFDDTYNRYIDDNKLSITTKAQFHSPGDIWNAIGATAGSIDGWMTYTVAAYSMLFGNQKLGFDGLIDLQTRQKIWDLVLDRLKKNKAEKVVDSLKLEMPRLDTSKLEDSSKDEK
ncbi:hypothetical protein [Marinimicrobium sp. LS-A18]|uniref:hypothetical protein n=1 Tax=Marinimicrobium sp. LS-A18 TaxID=1381596 RepID=UPI000463E7A9|nr:hypothetical protein [Marinimicrobium sp. LS-A18]